MQSDNLGYFIRTKREAIKPKVSLNKFAFDNDIDPAMLSRIETGKQDITYTTLKKIAKGFSMKLSTFFAEFENK